MIAIAICSGNQAGTKQLTGMLRCRFQLLCISADVHFYQTGEDLLSAMQQQAFAFVFLDTELPDSPGLVIAREIRGRLYDCEIIFLSASPEYALACYIVHPADFLLYPVKYERLCGTLSSFKKKLIPGLRSLDVISSRISISLHLADILYIEVLGHSCILHQMHTAITTNTSLTKLMQPLQGEPFLRVHRSYLVNFFHIKSLEPNGLLMVNGHLVPVSNENRQQVEQCLRSYFTALPFETPPAHTI